MQLPPSGRRRFGIAIKFRFRGVNVLTLANRSVKRQPAFKAGRIVVPKIYPDCSQTGVICAPFWPYAVYLVFQRLWMKLMNNAIGTFFVAFRFEFKPIGNVFMVFIRKPYPIKNKFDFHYN